MTRGQGVWRRLLLGLSASSVGSTIAKVCVPLDPPIVIDLTVTLEPRVTV